MGLSERRIKQLLAIEKAAQTVVQHRQISRQAALNALPDLIRAVESGPVGAWGQPTNRGA